MYKDTIMQGKQVLRIENSGHDVGAPTRSKEPKINKICDAFIKALQSRTSTNLQNIITAHVCKSPPDIEAGLLKVAELQSALHFKSDKKQANKRKETIQKRQRRRWNISVF